MNHKHLPDAIAQKLNLLFHSTKHIQFGLIGGGCINACYKVSVGSDAVFCKTNSAVKFPQLFLKEKHGLEYLAKEAVIRVPTVIDCFESDGQQILLMEWISEGHKTENFWKLFGKQLAALHAVPAEDFGWNEDNYIGSVPQSNKPSGEWNHFFIQQRLQPLLERCLSTGLLTGKHQEQFERLYQVLPSLFDPAQKPSLVHGDLWSGNFICDEHSEPVLIDPAVCFGHPAVDLGMSTLFGGFASAFYDAYHYHAPLPSNHKEQWEVCSLYPLLIHLYLFGSSYLRGIETTLKKFA